MSGPTFLTYHPLYDGRGFSPVRNSWGRYRAFRGLLDEMSLSGLVKTIEPPLATPEQLLPVHTREHVERVVQGDRAGTGYLDGKETPAWHGVLDRALAAVGCTLAGAEHILEGSAAHVFNPSGGLHHAHRDRASGFCIFNDVVLAVRRFQAAGLTRIAIVDVDGHHGDGTQELLYSEPVLCLSLHQYDGRFFPGSGSMDEVGWGPGYGSTVNVPLPRGAGDAAYRHAFDEIVPEALRRYRPEVILLNFGVDGHHADPLVRLALTSRTYAHVAREMHAFAHELCGGRLLAFGSGGYHPDNAARCWATLIAELSGAPAAMLACLDEPALPSPSEAARDQVRAIADHVRETVLPLVH